VAVAGERESNRLSKPRFANHGGLTPPALVRATFAHPAELLLLRCTNARSSRAAGVSLPCFVNRTGNHDSAHGHMRSSLHMRSSRGGSGAAGVSPPWDVEARQQGGCAQIAGPASRTKSGGREPAVGREPHRQPRLRTRARAAAGAASAVFRAIAAVPSRIRYREPRGAYPPRSCSRVFTRRRNCDFSDAQTHVRQERLA